MASILQFRRGTAQEAASYTLSEGEFFIDLDNKKLYVHDGIKQGGYAVDTTLDLTAINASIATKQNILESGTSIKTINGETLLGSGNISINIPSETITSLSLNGTILTFIDENNSSTNIDLSQFIDINLITSVNGQTGDVTVEVPVTSVNGQTGDVTVEVPVTSVNGQTGDVTVTLESGVSTVNGLDGDILLNVLPSNPTELNDILYTTPLDFTVSCSIDNGVLKGTFTSSLIDQRTIDGQTLCVFGKCIEITNTYQIFIGDRPPLTNNWNLTDSKLNRTFLTVGVDLVTEVDNGNGTFTYVCNYVKGSIPATFDGNTPITWMSMLITQLTDALSGNDVMGTDSQGQPIVLIEGSSEYAAKIESLLVNLSCYSRYTSMIHLVSGALGDLIS